MSYTDKRFCVYLHLDDNNNVRYIGHGSIQRAFSVSSSKSRGVKYCEFIEKYGKLIPAVVYNDLTKTEAIHYENELYSELIGFGYLLNSNKPDIGIKKITQEITSNFEYSEDSPSFLLWSTTADIRYPSKRGTKAGTRTKRGHYHVKVKQFVYKVHRIIFAIFNPDFDISNLVIDHVDGNPANNDISNLRAITQSINMRNRRFDTSKKGLPVGVVWVEKYNFFVASFSDPNSKTSTQRNRRITKSFSIKDYGSKDAALAAAIEFRDSSILDININYDLGYTKEHGAI